MHSSSDIVRRFAQAALLAIVCATMACGSVGTRTYQRIGTAGSILVLSGTALTITGRHAIPQDATVARQSLVSTGVTAQVVGIFMAIYALDGLIQASSEGPPARFPE